MHSLRTDDLQRPRHLNYCLNTSSGPWRCEAKCDHVGQKDLKPALFLRSTLMLGLQKCEMYLINHQSVAFSMLDQPCCIT